MTRTVTVIGGGVAGLTTAYRLVEAGVDVAVFEASASFGGKLSTVRVGDLDLEAGADSFVARKPWAVELCRELGLELSPPGSSGAYLWTDRGLVAYVKDAPFGIPGDIGDVLRWPGLSGSGRWRAAQDLVRGKRKDGVEETLGGLLRRRLGDEATDRSIAPLLAGLYAGDIDRLSAPATFPELPSWEASQGSLVRGSQAASRAAKRGTPGPMFMKPAGGMEGLTAALAARLGHRVRVDSPIDSLEDVRDVDATVLAVPAYEAARLVRASAPDAAAELDAIPYTSTGVVCLVYQEGTQAALPAGTGFVVPRGAAPMAACTWVSSKWPDPAFGTRAVLRCYVGGIGDEDVLDAADEELVHACARHLRAVLDLPEAPASSAVVRWEGSMPQYELGHIDRVRRIRDTLPPGIFVVGSAYDGVGIPDCAHAASETAERIVAHLGRTTSETLDKETAR